MAKTLEFKFAINASLGAGFGASFGEANGKISSLTQKIKELGQEGNNINLGKIGRNVGMALGGKALTDIGKSAIGTARSMGSSIMELSRDAISFEEAMSDVRKVVDFDTPQQFKEMGDDIVKLSKTLPMTTEEIAAIVATKLIGVPVDDLFDMNAADFKNITVAVAGFLLA